MYVFVCLFVYTCCLGLQREPRGPTAARPPLRKCAKGMNEQLLIPYQNNKMNTFCHFDKELITVFIPAFYIFPPGPPTAPASSRRPLNWFNYLYYVFARYIQTYIQVR